MKFIYTVWFRDPHLAPDDQDFEWPACFVVEAETAAEASSWGARLSARYSAKTDQPLISDSLEPFDSDLPGKETLPVIRAGHDASDEELGW